MTCTKIKFCLNFPLISNSPDNPKIVSKTFFGSPDIVREVSFFSHAEAWMKTRQLGRSSNASSHTQSKVEPIDQPTDQPINKPTNPLTERPTDQPTNRHSGLYRVISLKCTKVLSFYSKMQRSRYLKFIFS